MRAGDFLNHYILREMKRGKLKQCDIIRFTKTGELAMILKNKDKCELMVMDGDEGPGHIMPRDLNLHEDFLGFEKIDNWAEHMVDISNQSIQDVDLSPKDEEEPATTMEDLSAMFKEMERAMRESSSGEDFSHRVKELNDLLTKIADESEDDDPYEDWEDDERYLPKD